MAWLPAVLYSRLSFNRHTLGTLASPQTSLWFPYRRGWKANAARLLFNSPVRAFIGVAHDQQFRSFRNRVGSHQA